MVVQDSLDLVEALVKNRRSLKVQIPDAGLDKLKENMETDSEIHHHRRTSGPDSHVDSVDTLRV